MQKPFNIAAPNLVNICIDDIEDMEITGRLYCYYQKEPAEFQNSHQLLRIMGTLMSELDYPQSSVEFRTYTDRKHHKKEHHGQIPMLDPQSRQELLEERGRLDTLIVYVQYRQKATWQGIVYHTADESKEEFYSELEFLKIIDHTGKPHSPQTAYI